MSKNRETSVAGRTEYIDEFLWFLFTRKGGWPVVPHGITNFLTVTCADIEKEEIDEEHMRALIFQTIERFTYLESKTRSLMADYFTDPDSASIKPTSHMRKQSSVQLEYKHVKEMVSYESMHKVARREWQHIRRTLHTPHKVFGTGRALPTKIFRTSSSESVLSPICSVCL